MSEQIYVWDKVVRLFHWGLVALFVTSYITGEFIHSDLHIYSGYGIALLLIVRIVWGFVGSHYARFREFVYTPKKVAAYTQQMIRREPPRYIGHNPLGGLMVLVMLLVLLTTAFSGLKLYAVEEGKGPLANTTVALVAPVYADDDHQKHSDHDEDEEGEEFWEEVHEASVNIMLLLVILHIAGVVLSSLMHKESLVKAMLSGYKNKS